MRVYIFLFLIFFYIPFVSFAFYNRVCVLSVGTFFGCCIKKEREKFINKKSGRSVNFFYIFCVVIGMSMPNIFLNTHICYTIHIRCVPVMRKLWKPKWIIRTMSSTQTCMERECESFPIQIFDNQLLAFGETPSKT